MKKILIATLVAIMAIGAVAALETSKNRTFNTNRMVPPFKTEIVNKPLRSPNFSSALKIAESKKVLEVLPTKDPSLLNF